MISKNKTKYRKSHTSKNKHLVLRFFILFLFFFIAFWSYVNLLDFSQDDSPPELGVSFSHKYTTETLEMDWAEVYWAIINDLGVKKIRLSAYWDTIEAGNNEYNFNDLDWMIEQADEKDIKIILAVGRRLPRWPECHQPDWVSVLSVDEQDKELLEMVSKTVRHFRKYQNIIAWQVENEPFLEFFGECPPKKDELLKKEIALVKSLDQRPIIITDSGELSDWKNAAELADIFGSTMYKTVWNSLIGTWRYPLPPAYYYYKAKKIQEKYNLQKIIVSELQAESWIPKGQTVLAMPLSKQFDSFSLSDFKNNLKYFKRTGFSEGYLWGVEWWYWLKSEKGRPEFWETAQFIWQN